MNKDIIYIRAYGGALIPLNKVNLVTVNPNKSHVITQELPLARVLEHLYRLNEHYIISQEKSWDELEEYSIVKQLK